MRLFTSAALFQRTNRTGRSRFNEVRAAAGLPGLAFDEELAGLARTWAAKMATDGIISHNPNLSKQVTGNWSKVSENVGQGPDLETVHRALPKPAPTTTTVPVTVPVAAPVAAAVTAIDVSPWGSLVIDVTRTLELATG